MYTPINLVTVGCIGPLAKSLDQSLDLLTLDSSCFVGCCSRLWEGFDTSTAYE